MVNTVASSHGGSARVHLDMLCFLVRGGGAASRQLLEVVARSRGQCGGRVRCCRNVVAAAVVVVKGRVRGRLGKDFHLHDRYDVQLAGRGGGLEMNAQQYCGWVGGD